MSGTYDLLVNNISIGWLHVPILTSFPYCGNMQFSLSEQADCLPAVCG